MQKKTKGNMYKLLIDGVECAACAKRAVAALEQAPDVVYAEYVCNDSACTTGFARVFTASKRVGLLAVDMQAAVATEGFELDSIEGKFITEISKKASRKKRKKMIYGKFIFTDDNKYFEQR